MVIRNTQGAEGVLKQYEDCLREVHTVPSDVKEVETYRAKLKVNKGWFFSFCCWLFYFILRRGSQQRMKSSAGVWVENHDIC